MSTDLLRSRLQIRVLFVAFQTPVPTRPGKGFRSAASMQPEPVFSLMFLVAGREPNCQLGRNQLQRPLDYISILIPSRGDGYIAPEQRLRFLIDCQYVTSEELSAYFALSE